MQGRLVLDCIWSVKYGAFFTIARPFFDTRNFFNDFFLYYCVSKMKLNTFSVESFLIGIGLEIGFQLQSAITQILELFLNTNTFWSFNLCGFMTPNLIHTIYNESITRLYN